MSQVTPKHALILRPGAIGDAIVTLPTVQRLVAAWPGCQVTLVAGGQATSLLRGRCAAHQVASYDEPRWAWLFAQDMPEAMAALLAGMEAIIFYLANAESPVAGRLRARLGPKFCPWPALPPTPMAISLHLQGALRPWDMEPQASPPKLTLTGSDADDAARFWEKHQLGRAPVVALHPGSGSPRKNWPASRYAELGSLLATRYQARILIIAGPADGNALAEMRIRWRGPEPLVVENLPLAQVAALITRCRCLVGNDSGIAHLAAALGTPTVALFGATDPRIWAPQGPAVAILSAYGAPGGLERLGVDAVLRQALAYLQHQDTRP